MLQQTITSWGRVLKHSHHVFNIAHRFSLLPNVNHEFGTLLPYGNGRSYGDSALNVGGTLIKTDALHHFMAFDPSTGVLRCESGVLLADILKIVVSQGWFLPVTPGTRFITVGGAIANDVHGKNHHVMGTFGDHLRCFELLRSDGQRMLCSRTEHADFFRATVGGLGLTGLVTWAELQLRRIGNPWMDVETIRYRSLTEFFELCTQSDQDYEYTVSWVDCAGTGRSFGRGLFMRANHAPVDCQPACYQAKTRTFPFVPPVSLVNKLSLNLFNMAYYHKQSSDQTRMIQHYEPFFYPLDGLLQWNKMYGPKGFYQYQCILPLGSGEQAISKLLAEISQSGMGSFLAVLKVCGDLPSVGLLSFPQKGVSLALDFPNQGHRLQQLFSRLDTIVAGEGGRLYPAKDACMPATLFRSGYPQWQTFRQFIDPNFSSSFWRRVMEGV
jgi:FAD/FMN-containing dehydrogenase